MRRPETRIALVYCVNAAKAMGEAGPVLRFSDLHPGLDL